MGTTYLRPPHHHNLGLGTLGHIVRNGGPSVCNTLLNSSTAIARYSRRVQDIGDPTAGDSLTDGRGDGSLHSRVSLPVADCGEDLDFVALRGRERGSEVYQEGYYCRFCLHGVRVFGCACTLLLETLTSCIGVHGIPEEPVYIHGKQDYPGSRFLRVDCHGTPPFASIEYALVS